MKHNQYNNGFKFVSEPIEFNKNTDKEQLKYCLGATLYMPAIQNILPKILGKTIPGMTTIVMCFEDALKEVDIPKAEENVLLVLEKLSDMIESNEITLNEIPLLFLRMRNAEFFISFSEKLIEKHLDVLAGFIFPKFDCTNGDLYLTQLNKLNKKYNGLKVYGMPILESKSIAIMESRQYELSGIKSMLKPYKNYILNIRVGATDFSSIFGVRRGIDYSIYDILTIRDCLADILNCFNRGDEDYVLSAPVWEYFSMNVMEIKSTGEKLQSALLKRNLIVNEAIDGLLRELILDKANGFVGKTIIHSTHIPYVNALSCVTKEEFEDAGMILNAAGGVVKGFGGNKMNEIGPHTNWARRVYLRAQAYGVIESEEDYLKVFRDI